MCAQSKSLDQSLIDPALYTISKLIISLLMISFVSLAIPPLAAAQEKNADQAIEEFIQSAIDKHGLDRDYITTTLNNAKKNQTVLDAIARPWEAKPWHQYHPIFLTEKRLKRGLKFWKKHNATLQKAEAELGVPAHIIVAIIGVETYYGSYKGKYGVLDALYSLGFYYPPRSDFFKKELAQYLKLSQEEQWDPMVQKGSYAGAMGWGQFISSSYRHYSIDFDGDNKRDLLTNPVDAIGSVANYFRQHKWKSGEPVAFKVAIDEQSNKLINDDLKIQNTWQELQTSGVKLLNSDVVIESQTPAKLLALKQSEGYEHWTVLHNFYVITRYNHSPLYAMVIFQLSESLKEQMELL